MTQPIRPIPEGYGRVTPWIIVRGAAAFLQHVKDAFGAEERFRLENPDGTIGHAEFKIGDSMVMTLDAEENWPATPSFLRLYVENGDAFFARAIAAGCTPVTTMTELFFGERVGRVKDKWENLWWIHTRIADLGPEELASRAAEPAFIDSMRYVQRSLREEMRNRFGIEKRPTPK